MKYNENGCWCGGEWRNKTELLKKEKKIYILKATYS